MHPVFTSLLVAAVPALVAVQNGLFPTIAGYTSQGCYDEPVGTRALTLAVTTSFNMTVELCASFCSGYTYFGTEYGEEVCDSLTSLKKEISVARTTTIELDAS
jgi:hypothetical protein